ncbi:uncharacterized protein LOC118200514 [Stegodyphus dumicola]|uniref:uncharacterized protein LOC118200514 n=1 Tax=Stegodyphus dumicola TaxID=202533 RepID=UPI0015AC6EED|nr:uncharacterized protein LOC118200514 [Stegodyphus dumicola]
MAWKRLCLLGLALVSFTVVRADMPFQLRTMLSKADDSKNFWGMPEIHPIRMELEREPGVLLGTGDNLDLSKLANGDMDKAVLRSGNVPFGISSILRRNGRSVEEKAECRIHVQVTETYEGRCIRLRNSTPACQNDKYVAINYNECS